MRSTLVVAVLAVFAAVLVSAQLNNNNVEEDHAARSSFLSFMRKHERTYGSDEFVRRFNIFKKNLRRIEELNAARDGAVYGVTKFADLEEEEFRRLYLSPRTMNQASMMKMMPGASVSEPVYVKDLPDSWDWRTKGAVTPVKNQGQCGSCWAFSTTGNVEGQWFLKKGQLVSLSEQNLVDCDHSCVEYQGQHVCDSGCNGGLQWAAYQYIINNGGIDTEASYPYEGIDASCRYKSSGLGATVSNWTFVTTNLDEQQMASFLVSNGPIAIALNAGWLQFYVGGISDPVLCSPRELDHGVLIVGYGTGKNIFGKELDYWLVKNSWGSGWGEAGYFKIKRGSNKCGVAEVPSSAIIA